MCQFFGIAHVPSVALCSGKWNFQVFAGDISLADLAVHFYLASLCYFAFAAAHFFLQCCSIFALFSSGVRCNCTGLLRAHGEQPCVHETMAARRITTRTELPTRG
eukprot:TRINITY_DN30311_c0_g1_i1.p1 TRINITY_DN30311_c0_g1~~TRINITY_DN30311_c0_g1_i1.p1  ORF type:complete len:105 (+),score=7.09 TRINITY_DN30311_c0_g1_i1:217-531(+)